MKEQKEAIRQACIKANPSILDLKFGCEVWIGDEYDHGKYTIIERNGEDKVKVQSQETSDVDWVTNDSFYQILGRDIHLADVLLAIKDQDIVIGNTGMFFRIEKHAGSFLVFKPLYQWNLLKDTLDEQSPETIEFIYNLIK